MGRWAQARRRGSTAPAAASLPAPGQPYFEDVGGAYVQTSAAPGNEGGRVRLYQGGSETGPWILRADEERSSPYWWDQSGLDLGSWYCCSEVGNGTVYAGESAYSVAFLLE